MKRKEHLPHNQGRHRAPLNHALKPPDTVIGKNNPNLATRETCADWAIEALAKKRLPTCPMVEPIPTLPRRVAPKAIPLAPAKRSREQEI
jgi:hypothetical protein